MHTEVIRSLTREPTELSGRQNQQRQDDEDESQYGHCAHQDLTKGETLR